jgi:NAD dependent epimerase/dehydratase family enzyme
MRVVILGGSGLIGRAVTRALIDRGHEVLVLSRNTRRTAGRLPPGATAADWTNLDLVGLAEHLRGTDALVNVAGAPVGPWPWTARRRRTILASRVEPTAALVAALGLLDPTDRPRVLANRTPPHAPPIIGPCLSCAAGSTLPPPTRARTTTR